MDDGDSEKEIEIRKNGDAAPVRETPARICKSSGALRTAFKRMTRYSPKTLSADLSKVGMAVSELVLFAVNFIIMLITLLIAVGGKSGVFPLAVGLLQMLPFAWADLHEYCVVVSQKDEDSNHVLIQCYPPIYLVAAIIIFVGSIGCLFSLVSCAVVTTAHIITSYVLLSCYTPIVLCKIRKFALAFRGEDDKTYEQYDFVGLMRDNVFAGAGRRRTILEELEDANLPFAGNKRDRLSYDSLWDAVIRPEIEKLQEEGYCCKDLEETKDRIWFCYFLLNLHTSVTYMKDCKKPLDRHKIASCYMYAITCAGVFEPSRTAAYVGANDDQRLSLADERLAVTVAASVLSSFLKTRLLALSVEEDDESLRKELCGDAALLEERGIVFPSPVGHGETYEDSLYRSLWFTSAEGNYNVLTMSLVIFGWESNTLSADVRQTLADYYQSLAKKSVAL